MQTFYRHKLRDFLTCVTKAHVCPLKSMGEEDILCFLTYGPNPNLIKCLWKFTKGNCDQNMMMTLPSFNSGSIYGRVLKGMTMMRQRSAARYTTWYQSIQFKVSAIIVLIVLIPMVIFWQYFFSLSMRHTLEQSSSSMFTALYGASLTMQNMMDVVSDFSRDISRDPELLELARNYQDNWNQPDSHEAARSRLSLALSQQVSRLRTLDSIYIYFESSKFVVTMLPEQKEFSSSDAYAAQFYQLYYNVFESPMEWWILPAADGSGQTLSLIRTISLDGGRGKCVMICNLKSSAWEPVLRGLYYGNSTWYISSYAGRVLLSSEGTASVIGQNDQFSHAFSTKESQGSYSGIVNGQRCQITYYNAVESGWKYLVCVPENEIFRGARNGYTFYGTALLCGILSFALGSLILFFYVIRPIHILTDRMKAAEGGNWEPIEPVQPKDELGLLFHSYNHMTSRLRQLLDEVYIQQLLRKQAQLSFLQSQMDEHFLFNTLNTIYGEACRERADASARMILTLSRYFRLSLSYGKEKLPLDQICYMLQLYLQMQKMRFGTALSCKVEQFPDMSSYVALKYLFQPILENAIVHGLEKNFEHHHIQIVFRKKEELLYFEVCDDGVGIAPDQLSRLLRQINGEPDQRDAQPSPSSQQDGFALKNIQEQIYITYGDYKIHMESQLGKGTKVYFIIPLERGT